MVVTPFLVSKVLPISYLFFLFMFFNSNSLLIFWLLTEVNLIIFLLIMHKLELTISFSKFSLILFYFIVQSLGRMLLILRFCFSELEEVFYLTVLVVRMVIKIGFWPLHTWLFIFVSNLSFVFFFLIIRFQKLPGILILFRTNFDIIVLILVANTIYGCILLFRTINLFQALICSSLYSSLWFYLFFISSFYNFITFFFIYSLSILPICALKNYHISLEKPLEFFLVLSSLIFLTGLPPYRMFFYKFNLIESFYCNISVFVWVFLWIFSFLALTGYFKNLYFIFFKRNFFYRFLLTYKLNKFMPFYFFFFFFFSTILFWSKLC